MHRDAFEQVLELNRAADFREDGERIWIPFDERRTDLHVIAFVDLEFRAVHDRIALLLAAFLVHDRQHTVTIHCDQEACLIPDSLEVMELDRAGVLGRSEEHTSELQSPDHLVCRLLLEKKKKHKKNYERHNF